MPAAAVTPRLASRRLGSPRRRTAATAALRRRPPPACIRWARTTGRRWCWAPAASLAAAAVPVHCCGGRCRLGRAGPSGWSSRCWAPGTCAPRPAYWARSATRTAASSPPPPASSRSPSPPATCASSCTRPTWPRCAPTSRPAWSSAPPAWRSPPTSRAWRRGSCRGCRCGDRRAMAAEWEGRRGRSRAWAGGAGRRHRRPASSPGRGGGGGGGGGGGEGQREGGDGGELGGEASGAGAGFWPLLERRRTTVQGLTRGGGGGGGEVEEVPPGAAEVALGKLAALLRGKSRKSLTQLTSESSTGAVGSPVRTTSSFAVRQSCSASGTPAAWAAVVAAATAAATAGSAAPPIAAAAAPGVAASLGALTSGSSSCGPGDALASADSLDRSSDLLVSAHSELATPTPSPAPALPRTSSPAATPAPHLALSRSCALLPQPSTSAARTYPAAPVYPAAAVYPAAGAAPPLDLILAAPDAPTVASRTGGRVTPRGTPTPRGSPQRSRASTRDGTPPRDSTPPRDHGSSPRGTPVPRGTVTPMHTPLATPRVQGVQVVAPATDGRAAPAPVAAPVGCADATPSQLVIPGYSPAPFSAYATACALATSSASSAAVPTSCAGAGVAPSAQAAAAEEAALYPPPPLPPRSAPPCDAGFARSPSSRHTHSAPLTHVAPSATASPPSMARQAPPSSTLAQLQEELDQKPPLSARSVLTGSLTSRTPCSKNVVGSVKALLRGWQTARAATSCGTGGGGVGGAAEPGGGVGGGLTPQQRAAARFAAAEARSATVPGAPPSSPPTVVTAGLAAPPSVASTWSRESVAMAMAAAQGEHGRLAAICSGMLRHGESAVRPNLESALLQHLQSSQQLKASALKNKAATALVPTAHNGASAAAAVSAWAAARGGTPVQPVQAEPSCRVAAGPALAPPAPAASPRALAPYGRTSQRPMQSTRHASPSGRGHRSPRM